MRAVSIIRGRGKAKDKGPSIHAMAIHKLDDSAVSYTTGRANKSCSQYCKPILECIVEYAPDKNLTLSVWCFKKKKKKKTIDPNAWIEHQNVLWLHSKAGNSIQQTGADTKNYEKTMK